MVYSKNGSRKYDAFTLIEILVVVGLIAILAAVTIVAINPAKNFRQTRDAQRSADVTAILNAVTQFTSEEGNSLTSLVAETGFGANNTLASCGSGTNDIINQQGTTALTSEDLDLGIDLFTVLVDEYIVAIPEDPSISTDVGDEARDTGYDICETVGGRVTISAPGAEGEAEIVVSR